MSNFNFISDHLRGHYQIFQNLAFCMKKKNPSLRRNIKFDDRECSLVMDVRTEDGWRTIEYATARNILKNRPKKTTSLSGCDVEQLLNKSDVVDSEDSETDMDEDVTIIEEKDVNNKKPSKSYPKSISFVNTNARSLMHKVISLGDSFDELGLNFAQVTETWLQSNTDTQDLALRLRDGHSLGIITRNRSHVARNGRQYGGIALIYRLSSKFSVFPFPNRSDFETMATIGNIKGVKEKVGVVTCYMPPNMTLLEARSMIEHVSDLVGELKRVHDGCLVVLGGDFNQWPIEEILEDHPDIKEADVGPTRGDRRIDRVFTNFSRSISESGTRTPLETEDGSPSDHKQAFVRAVFEKVAPKTTKYTYRPFTRRGADAFAAAMETANWGPVFDATSSSDKTVAFQSVVEREMDRCFPLKTTVKLDSDPPWVNNQIRALGRKRRKVYDREGRSAKWKRLKKKKAELYRKRARVFVETKKKNLTGPDASRFFFKHVKAFKSKEKPPDFNVSDLFPGKSEEEISELLATHFGKISNEFNGIEDDRIPTSYDSPIRPLSVSDVELQLRRTRKPKSMVRGDIFPSLVNRVASHIAPALTSIYNSISSTLEWPNYWKTEFVTAIPKKPVPLNTNDLRNISCTPFLSKTYEGFVLDWLGEQTSLRSNQYGGVKGCGTEHFLVELWQQVLENLDDYRAASFITSIDYSKAFNRLDFSRCLDALKSKGASTQLLGIVGSFLSNRMMTVKVGNSFSGPRPVLGGVPQGSRLGVLLFNATIDSFEAFSHDIVDYGREGLPPNQLGPPATDLPVSPDSHSRNYRHMPPFASVPIQVLKYVDDNILHEKINFENIPTDGYGFKSKHAKRTQNLFWRIVAEAEACGMKVNADKTQTMCISEVKTYNPSVHFFDRDGNKTSTLNEMRVLGVTFSSQPDMAIQAKQVIAGLRARVWSLSHLAHHGLSESDLLQVYKSSIRPVHDYCSCVYNSTLTDTQSNALERLQAKALKNIYGYEHSYSSLLQRTGLTTLKVRRDNRCLKFALKAAANPRYAHWFPRNNNRTSTRAGRTYLESRAKTKRLFNSPIYDMRRRLNASTPAERPH